ncbi:MAG: glycosyltransferase family 2 protein [Pseudomonadota bacterium]|nr:glycosyltransferase family 2 protein [Pseudomonadota bacterium]
MIPAMMALRFLLGGIALFWLGAAYKTWRGQREGKWRLGPDAAVRGGLPRLVVVVPARNEAKVIGACVAALRASDHPDFVVRVYDDGSTDGTGALATAAGAEVLSGGDAPLPEGWKGKPWALVRATRDVTAEWILFLDADVRVHPAALSRAHSRAMNDSVDFLSGFGRLEMGSFWEKVIQPSVGGLIIAGNDLDGVNDPERTDKIIANGQFILVRRAAYEAVGGHGAVKDDILDDVGLAKAFVAAGHTIRVLFMRELFACRMYTNLHELWFGWTKNLFAGMGYRRDRVVFLIGVLLVEFLLPYGILIYGLATGHRELLAWGVGLVALIHVVRAWLDRLFGQDLRYGLLQPLGAAMLIGLLYDSSRRSRTGRVIWKGRTYSAARPPEAPPAPGIGTQA